MKKFYLKKITTNYVFSTFICFVFLGINLNAVMATNLLHHWSADGNAKDVIGSANGMLEGTVSYAPGKIGQSFKFNGKNYDGINLGDVPDLNFSQDSEYTISAWINLADIVETWSSIILLNYPCKSTEQGLVIDKNRVSFVMRDSYGITVNVTSANEISKNIWYHIVGVREINSSDKILKLYINGKLAASAIDTTSGQLSNSGPDYIGRRYSCPSNNPFNGLIDEISIYNGALSEAEIQEIYSLIPISGCLKSFGRPLQNGTVLMTQSGEFHQSTELDENGCFQLKRLNIDKPYSIMIRKKE